MKALLPVNRNLWFVTLLVGLTLGSPATFRAAPQTEVQAFHPIRTGGIYVGPAVDDRGLEQRAVQTSGDIDVYNIWPSFQPSRIKSDLSIGGGHQYQFCSNRHASFFVNTMIVNHSDAIDFNVTYTFQGAARGKVTCVFRNVITFTGVWVVWCDLSLAGVANGLYKVTGNHSVTSGGSGSGKETSFFDVRTCR